MKIIKFIFFLFLFFTYLEAKDDNEYNAIYDFGTINQYSEIIHSFDIKNNYDEDLYIEKIIASCDCIYILEYPKVILSHSIEKIIVKLIASKQSNVAYELDINFLNKKRYKYLLIGNIIQGQENKSKIINEFITFYPYLVREVEDYNKEYFINFEDYLNISSGNNYILVDIRSKNEFEVYNIKDSINMPLHQIKNKSFLKFKKILLINNGFNHFELLDEVQQLQKRNFNIKILFGGIYAYARFQKELSHIIHLHKITPFLYFDEKNYKNLFLICTDLKPSHDIFLFPNVITIPFVEGNEKDFLEKFRNIISKDCLLNVLILNQNGNDYNKISNLLINEYNNIYYLDGGILGYKNFIVNQKNILNPKIKSIKVKKCQGCL